jgi:peptidyl-prolyl cis-trans isomerase B (cyclophilin B)
VSIGSIISGAKEGPLVKRKLVRSALLALAAVCCLPVLAQSKKAKTTKKEAAKPRDYANTYAVLHTTQGDVTLKFFYDKAPGHVKNFIDLAAKGFYDGTRFHRVIPGFMIQGGDPLTKDAKNEPRFGTGGATDAKGAAVNVKGEFNDTPHKRGVLSMARASDPNSASSQFFVVVKDSVFLDRNYTAFGEVFKGMEVVDKLVTASDPDTNDPRTGGKPRQYQSITKIDLVEGPPA